MRPTRSAGQTRRPIVALVPVVGLLGALAACAGNSAADGAGWTRDGTATAERASDSRACKREADDYAMRRVHQPDRAMGDGMMSPLAQVDRSEARTLHREYYASCMAAKGYQPTR